MKSTAKLTKEILRGANKTSSFKEMVIEKLLSLPTSVLNEEETKDLVAKQIAEITGKDESTTRSHITMLYNELVFGIKRKKKGQKGRKSVLQKFVDALSPVKKQIGEAILSGKKSIYLNRNFRPAYVTMVATKIAELSNGTFLITKAPRKGVKIGKKEFDGQLLNKEIVRNNVVEKIIASLDNTGTVLTLPAMWELELKLIKQKALDKLNFIGCEFNPVTPIGHNKRLRQIRKRLFKLKKLKNRVLDILETPIGTMIKLAIENAYAHAILDYCGNINTYASEIELALTKKIVKVGGIVMITCTKTSRKIKGVNATKDLLDIAGRNKNYKIEKIEGQDVFEYTDIKKGARKGTAMVAMIVRRVK